MPEIENDSKETLGLSKEDLEALFASTFAQISDKDINEDERSTSNITPNTPFFDPNSEREKDETKVKSPLRLKYEAEVSSIIKQHGDLETIRRKLGLSKRKMAQMLMVDPSAWTRWTAEAGEAPPHIYRALEWYLILQDKHPEYKSSLWLNSVARPQLSQQEIENIKKTVLALAQKDLPNREKEIINLNKKLKYLVISQAVFLLLVFLIMLF